MILFLQGLFVGLIICAPVGPVGALCIRRALRNGRLTGLASYMGAATVDGIYCSIAGFGPTILSSFVAQGELWLQLTGSLILIAVGIGAFASAHSSDPCCMPHEGPVRGYISTLLLTLSNPVPIALFTGIIAWLGVGGWKADFTGTALLVAGVFIGSATWGPIIVSGLGFFIRSVELSRQQLVSRIAGIIIAVFGLAILIKSLWQLAG